MTTPHRPPDRPVTVPAGRDGAGRDRIDDLWAAIAAGNRRALARAITVLEAGDRAALAHLMRLAHPRSGHAHVVGVTGAPGVGKSSLTGAVVADLRRRGHRVAVVAIDPSSPYSSGAVLGDRVRMHEHAGDPDVYVRSMAARGQLGGLAAATPGAIVLLAAAGFDVVLVETVGVGQSEVALATAADTVVLTLVPGLGDAVQAEKAGIMEIADVFVVNKADQPGAGQVESTVRAAAATAPPDRRVWTPPVHLTVAVRGEGVPALVESIVEHHVTLVRTGELVRRRTARARLLVEEAVVDRLRAGGPRWDGLDELAARVARYELDPYAAVDIVLRHQGG